MTIKLKLRSRCSLTLSNVVRNTENVCVEKNIIAVYSFTAVSSYNCFILLFSSSSIHICFTVLLRGIVCTVCRIRLRWKTKKQEERKTTALATVMEI